MLACERVQSLDELASRQTSNCITTDVACLSNIRAVFQNTFIDFIDNGS